eukprot:2605140-Amphidinium_carterae.2
MRWCERREIEVMGDAVQTARTGGVVWAKCQSHPTIQELNGIAVEPAESLGGRPSGAAWPSLVDLLLMY